MMFVEKPFSQACENNKGPILQVLKKAFVDCKTVLEIGSGTGQHATCFADALPYLEWQTSDRAENHSGINLWIDEFPCENLHRPLELDVDMSEWPIVEVDAIFTANTCHIMSWSSVQNLFAGIARYLKPGGIFCVYGPFNYNGQFTSESNRQFDLALKADKPHQGIRDFEAIAALATKAGLQLIEDHEMPANNRLLEWGRESDF